MLFGAPNGELTYRISRGTALFLSSDRDEMKTIHSQVKKLYNLRSKYVHEGKNVEWEKLFGRPSDDSLKSYYRVHRSERHRYNGCSDQGVIDGVFFLGHTGLDDAVAVGCVVAFGHSVLLSVFKM